MHCMHCGYRISYGTDECPACGNDPFVKGMAHQVGYAGGMGLIFFVACSWQPLLIYAAVQGVWHFASIEGFRWLNAWVCFAAFGAAAALAWAKVPPFQVSRPRAWYFAVAAALCLLLAIDPQWHWFRL